MLARRAASLVFLTVLTMSPGAVTTVPSSLTTDEEMMIVSRSEPADEPMEIRAGSRPYEAASWEGEGGK